MWKIVHASVAGTSHLAQGTPCQDACGVVSTMLRGEPVLLIAISDGAGSARQSQEGAAFVMRNWLEQAVVVLEAAGVPDESTLRDLAEKVRGVLIEHVAAVGGQLGDYACTLLGAAIFPQQALFFQIGDGAWVCRTGEEYRCPTWPFHGEFAGETLFLTSHDYAKGFQTARMGEIEAVAGLTDGMERLALKLIEREPSPAFFGPLFVGLKALAPEHAEEQLRIFLNSDRVNDRTDDDKTLVLAMRNSQHAAL